MPPRQGVLNCHNKFVASYTLPVPAGHGSLESFLGELIACVLSRHKASYEPLMQTLKQGTQTPGRLFYDSAHPIQLLKASLCLLIEDYIAGLPDDALHPFLSRKSKRFKFSGSWSVKLSSGGFHVSHVHPQGWISSSFYLHIPSSMRQKNASAAATNAGSIQFGESPYGINERDVAERMVRPKPGRFVLFPSYFWHGTIPFAGNDSDFRLTTPFDVQPI